MRALADPGTGDQALATSHTQRQPEAAGQVQGQAFAGPAALWVALHEGCGQQGQPDHFLLDAGQFGRPAAVLMVFSQAIGTLCIGGMYSN